MIDIGTEKQFFIDDLLFDSSENVELCMNPPAQHPEPVFTPRHEWEEQGLGLYNTVLRDEGRFRLWYAACMKLGLPSEGAIRLCYAESDDGLNWECPTIGRIPFRGSKDNNIVAPPEERQRQQGAAVYHDDRAPAEERYKFWTKFRPTDDQVEAGWQPGLYAMHSPDGIDWRLYPEQPNPPAKCDTQNVFFWDDRIDAYVGYTRDWASQAAAEAAEAGPTRYRSVARWTSPDFRNWSGGERVFEADEEDLTIPVPGPRTDGSPVIDFYTNCVTRAHGASNVYFMFPAAFYHWGEEKLPATFDVQLLTSRDGITWRRAGGRRPFLRKGLDVTPSGGMIVANPTLIDVGNETWLYYTGTGRRHVSGDPDAPPPSTGLFRATMRRDGIMSADAGWQGGEFTTPPLRHGGRRLKLNFDGSAGGWLQVELQSADGETLPGHARQDCDPVYGNDLARTVTWGGSPGLPANGALRLRVFMRDMKLYTFRYSRH